MQRSGGFPAAFPALGAALVVVSAAGLLAPAAAVDLPPLRSQQPPLFHADPVISLEPDGHPALAVTIAVPHGQLQWLRTDRGYAAAAEFTIVFEPESRRRQFGDVWDRSLLVAEFAATSGATLIEKRTFEVPPGRYRLRVGLRDLNAERQSESSEALEVPDYSKVPVGFADLELGVLGPDSLFQPVPSRRYGVDVARLVARAALFDRRPGPWPRTYPFRWRILDDSGAEVRSGAREATLEHSAAAVLVRPDSSELFVGAYVFQLELNEGESKWLVDRSFEVEESGPPRGRDFERILEPLSFIADAEDVDQMRDLPPDRQAAAWDAFWRRRDPTPETSRNEAMLEFLRRVRYVERHFQNFGPGWRSDMGRIYIRYGGPDQVESRPSNSSEPALEIWYYNRPYRRFVFADREGFGRYVLVSPGFE